MQDWLLDGMTLAGALLVLATMLGGCGPRYRITETRTPLRLGEASVDVALHQAEAPGLTFINLHDNEDTAAQAALEVIGEHGGRLLELRHSGQRNVAFVLEDSAYVFDPNRIFTEAGIAATLDTLGAYSPAAHDAVRAFADSLLRLYDLDGLGVVVTVHNNGDTEYSALSYTDGGDLARDARLTHLAEGADPDDFFFVTDLDLFDALRLGGFNVVLQDNERVTDDGSLSVYCGLRGLAYVNVEAQHRHRREQVRMITYLAALLRPPPA